MRTKVFTEKIKINLAPKQYRFLQEQAMIKGKTVSAIVREMIETERKYEK